MAYLLHGLGGGRHEWRRDGRVADTLDRLIAAGELAPLIAVMPEAGKSWYVDSARFGGEGDYERAIVQDLIPGIDATSYGRKWVMRFERAAYRGGRPNLPEPP